MNNNRIDQEFAELIGEQFPAGDQPRCERCGSPAVAHVAMHRWGDCDAPADDQWDKPESVDADGNICALMCRECTGSAMATAELGIRKVRAATPAGIVPHCPTCSRPTVEASDICQVTPL